MAQMLKQLNKDQPCYNNKQKKKWATSWENLYMWTTKAQISLRIPAVWSAPLLFAAWIVYYLYLL